MFTLSIVLVIRLSMDPDSVRARQSDAMLRLASKTLESMQDGLNRESAQEICQLLLPSTAAIAVAITDKKQILGYAGYLEAENPAGGNIRTHATQATLDDGNMRVLFTSIDIGFPRKRHDDQSGHRCPAFGARRRGGHAEVLLSLRQAHQRDSEVDCRRVRYAAFDADGCGAARRAGASCHEHGAQGAAEPDQPALPVQHHQHDRLAHPHESQRGPRASARVRGVLPPHAGEFRQPHLPLARGGADAALLLL